MTGDTHPPSLHVPSTPFPPNSLQPCCFFPNSLSVCTIPIIRKHYTLYFPFKPLSLAQVSTSFFAAGSELFQFTSPLPIPLTVAFEVLLSQLQLPFLIVLTFNTITLWGDSTITSSGRSLERWPSLLTLSLVQTTPNTLACTHNPFHSLIFLFAPLPSIQTFIGQFWTTSPLVTTFLFSFLLFRMSRPPTPCWCFDIADWHTFSSLSTTPLHHHRSLPLQIRFRFPLLQPQVLVLQPFLKHLTKYPFLQGGTPIAPQHSG